MAMMAQGNQPQPDAPGEGVLIEAVFIVAFRWRRRDDSQVVVYGSLY